MSRHTSEHVASKPRPTQTSSGETPASASAPRTHVTHASQMSSDDCWWNSGNGDHVLMSSFCTARSSPLATSTMPARAEPVPFSVDVMVEVKVPSAAELGATRAPADVCLVVDISGSMGSIAQYEGADGKMTNDGCVAL